LLFVDLPGIDQLFHRTSSQESVNWNIARLAESKGAVHGLQIVRWVPIWIYISRERISGTRKDKEGYIDQIWQLC
jgi:hypothetical protein